MPIFDYYCDACSTLFEAFEKNSDLDSDCPECEAKSKRVYHTEQNIKRCEYIPPPKASRKFGDERATPYQRKRWL